MKNISVKLKITLWYTAVLTVVSVAILITMNSVSHEIIHRDAADRVTKTVEETARHMSEPSGHRRPMPAPMFYGRGVHMALYDSEQNIIGGQIPFGITESMDFEDGKLRLKNYNGNEYYIFDKKINIPQGSQGHWLKGIISLTDEGYAVGSVMKNNFILTMLLLLIAALGGYFIISRAFVPVNKIRSTAREISESRDLKRRINIGPGGDEICLLANTFDDMLDKIEQAFENEKQFTSDASHELRTPIAVILSECEYMTECAASGNDFRESAEAIKRQAEKMSRLVGELLTISRMDKNTLKLNSEVTDLSELLTFVCEEQRDIHSESDITLTTNIANAVTAKTDRDLIARLFINLISNAYQYSRDKGEIIVSLTKQSGNIIFSVKDNGIGISKEHLPKIWERFYQVDPARSSRENGSMGLGLSMVKWIAEKSGGYITVESELDCGSEFIFTLPEK